jgi:diadenosine tetraphosphate (Ap4A) HIT family hydrolase
VTGNWGAEWMDMASGARCPMCRDVGMDDKPGGVRIMAGEWSDSYLSRRPVRRGHVYVIWSGRHVVEPTELDPEEAAGFWAELLIAAQAVQRCYSPRKLNILLLGNGVPHLHGHVVPRYDDDEDAGRPLGADVWVRAAEADAGLLAGEAEMLRAALAEEGL